LHRRLALTVRTNGSRLRLAAVHGLPNSKLLGVGEFVSGVGGRCHKPPDRPTRIPPPPAAFKNPETTLQQALTDRRTPKHRTNHK